MSRDRNAFGLGLIMAAACLFTAAQALAWGDNGHKIVCGIAMKEVSATTRAHIEQLMRQLGSNADYATGCTFPDHPRERPKEHFVNLPREAAGVTNDL
jgi:hypothetical protein